MEAKSTTLKRMAIEILYEHEHYLVISKPIGITVESDKQESILITDILNEQCNTKGLKAAHRIDRPVSGALIICKTAESYARFHLIFREVRIRKIYHALVKNKPENDEGRLVNYLRKIQRLNVSRVYTIPVENSKEAILSYKVIQEVDEVYLLEIQLETGRHHQIRSQLKHIGSPIIGDVKYGSTIQFNKHGIMLHSRRLAFICPFDNVQIEVEAEYPELGLWRLFK